MLWNDLNALQCCYPLFRKHRPNDGCLRFFESLAECLSPVSASLNLHPLKDLDGFIRVLCSIMSSYPIIVRPLSSVQLLTFDSFVTKQPHTSHVFCEDPARL